MQMSKFWMPKYLWLQPQFIAEVRYKSVVDRVTKEENALPCLVLLYPLQVAPSTLKLDHDHNLACRNCATGLPVSAE